MKALLTVCIALLLIYLPRHSAGQPDGVTAFRNVNVVSMTSTDVMLDQTVIVRAEHIEAIVPSAAGAIPAGARIIAGNGRFLMPGLAEMHAHVPSGNSGDYLQDVLFLYAANGITTARGMLGEPAHLALREDLRNHRILGPRLITSGPSLSGQSVATPAEAQRMVEAQAKAGYDFIKLHPGLSLAQFEAAVSSSRTVGIPLAGHVSAEVGVVRALAAGQATIDHLDGYIEILLSEERPEDLTGGFFGLGLADYIDASKIDAAAKMTADAGVWIVPTQSLIEHWARARPTADELIARPEMAYVAPETVRRWATAKRQLTGDSSYSAQGAERLISARQALIRSMHRHGVGLLLGSDAPQVFNVPGFSLHHELAMIVEAGLSPYEALRTGTVNAARFFDMENEFGQVRVGLAADLILVEQNPLTDVTAIARPAGVMLRGHWLDRGDLDAGLAAIARRHRR